MSALLTVLGDKTYTSTAPNKTKNKDCTFLEKQLKKPFACNVDSDSWTFSISKT